MNILRNTVATGIVVTTCAALGFLTIALLNVTPPDRNYVFWIRLVWAEAIIFITCWSVFAFLSPQSNDSLEERKRRALLPSLSVVVFVYAVLSLGLLLINTFDAQHLSDTLFLTLQTVITIAAIGVITIISVSTTHAAAGLGAVFLAGHKPADLCNVLLSFEHRLASDQHSDNTHCVRNAIRSLRESIEFGLPQVGDIARNPEYADFSEKVVAAARACIAPPLNPQTNTALIEQLSSLTDESNALSRASIKR